jgi:MFS family permease
MEAPRSDRMTFIQWLVCIIAAIGFAFDIYELLMLPLVVRDALMELGKIAPGTPEFAKWFGLLFYVPAVCGGLFGLLGGYLTDRFGRRRVLTWSILLYAFSAFLAGFSTSLPMLLFFRTTTFIGVCVEFVAAVAWLAELFDEPRQRERVLGYTQAFSSFGGILVAFVHGIIANRVASLPAIEVPAAFHSIWGAIGPAGQHAVWRYTLMSGLIPAIPLIVIRPFLPESPKWAAKKAAGTLQRPSIRELFSPALRRTTIVTTLMFACSYGVAFGALQQLQQIVPGIDAVRSKVEAVTAGKPAPEAAKLAGATRSAVVANYTKSQELGGLFGRFALAMLVVGVASRQKLVRLFLIPAAFIVPGVFWMFSKLHENVYWSAEMNWLPGLHNVSLTMLGIGIFLAGFFVVAVFSFWGNYLPHVFPVHLRGTGESFAANIGGRMLGTPFAYVTQAIVSGVVLAGAPQDKLAALQPAATAKVAAIVALVLIVTNIGLSFLLPEPQSETLPD